jgi:hypothetical protein
MENQRTQTLAAGTLVSECYSFFFLLITSMSNELEHGYTASEKRVFFSVLNLNDAFRHSILNDGRGVDFNPLLFHFFAFLVDPVWAGKTAFQLDYLTKPSGLLDIGLDISGFNPVERVKKTDSLLIAAYPHFDPREMVAVDKVRGVVLV